MFGLLKARRRRRLRASPFPEPWRRLLHAHVPLLARLDAMQRTEVEGHIQVFLAEKAFVGAAGLEVTEEMRLVVAAQAALLLLGRSIDAYRGLHRVVIYPTSFTVRVKTTLASGVVIERDQARRGESWTGGDVVLAWDAVRHGAREATDGDNVTLHEFAHQLDQEDGTADGVPTLDGHSAWAVWSRAFHGAWTDLQQDGHAHALDAYGATHPAELFAVATEAYFERPALLRARQPALYEALADFYRLRL